LQFLLCPKLLQLLIVLAHWDELLRDPYFVPQSLLPPGLSHSFLP
jgi:hypothetical protein